MVIPVMLSQNTQHHQMLYLLCPFSRISIIASILGYHYLYTCLPDSLRADVPIIMLLIHRSTQEALNKCSHKSKIYTHKHERWRRGENGHKGNPKVSDS